MESSTNNNSNGILTATETETTTERSIRTLNNLLETNNDRIEGYEHASKETDEADLKIIFSQLRETSYKCREELKAEIVKLGGTPIEGTSTAGKLYHVWMDVRAALTAKDRKAILKSCETGEDVAVKNYETALKDILSIDTANQLIARQYTWIKSDHDKVKGLRDSTI